MTFPRHILAVLDRFGVQPETKAALADLYLAMGSDVLESLADLTAGALVPSEVRPEDLSGIREALIRRFLARSHPEWLAGQPTPSFWHPRAAEGRASGLLAPIGRSDGSAVDAFSTSVFDRVRAIVGADQPAPEGVLLFGKNAHFGGRAETVSFDVVPADPDDAMAVALAEGRQHTAPGSVGETSGTADPERSLLLLWEIQPNVLKPQGERNRAIGPIFRRHRNWHVTTLVLALRWAEVRKLAIYILKGEALAATHEVNRHQPVTPEVQAMHERTIHRVAEGMGYRLEPAGGDDEVLLLDSELMNTGLRQRVESEGSAGAVWRVVS